MAKTKDNVLLFFDKLLRMGVGFLKAQLIFFLINLAVIAVCLALFGVRPAFWIALGISVLDLLPIVGSGAAFLPWIIVNICLGAHSLALRLALLYIGLAVLRQVLEPLITGRQIGLKPIVALLAALCGALVFGMAGVIIGPLIAAVVNIILDIRRHNSAGSAPRDKGGGAAEEPKHRGNAPQNRP